MKNAVLFIFCLFAMQLYGQEDKTKNQQINDSNNNPAKMENQDYNSSRSNKPSPIRDTNGNVNDSVPQPQEAQDYNSSRSNKPSPIRDTNGNENDSVPQPQEAQDYNSSRSNKPSPIRDTNGNENDSVPQPQEAQDYNSSRSNKPSPIVGTPNDTIVDSNNEPAKMENQDYNSSRSNKPSPIVGTPNDTIVDSNNDPAKLNENTNPLYEGDTSDQENPLYESSSLTSPSIEVGGVFSGIENDTDGKGFVNKSKGLHVGLYIPIVPKKQISFGVNISGEYLMANKDGFNQEPAGFKVNQLESTISRSCDQTIFQSITVIGAGPQVNYSLADKLNISGIVQAGITSFKQDGFAYNQVFAEGEAGIPVEVFRQEETKSTNFFWIPKLRLSYAITSNFAIWAEGNYMMSKVETKQSQLAPGEPQGEEGAYFFGQINSAESIEKTVESDLKGTGFAVGISVSL